MKKLLYNPVEATRKMTIACFVSGAGTNYREVVKANPELHYIVFTNRPESKGKAIAREYDHEIIELSHIPFLSDARIKYGPGNIPRNCEERIYFEKEISNLIEKKLNGEPDLICLLGYDQWLTDWMVDKYYPRIINIHPGDTTKGYDGLHWIPTAKAILASDVEIRSTLFIVDKGEDTGPVLIQSKPLNIAGTLNELDRDLKLKFEKVTNFINVHAIKTFDEYKEKAVAELMDMLEKICKNLQDRLKVTGDWAIYPFAIHCLIAQGRVEIDGRTIYIDGEMMPEYGYRIDKD